MSLRLFVLPGLALHAELPLPEDAARHVQVRRMQPGEVVCLFDGRGGEWHAEIVRMGKRDVAVRVVAHDPVERGLGIALEIAFGMPANERMDALVEKATELGASAIHPLRTARSVLRLDGERAARRVAHWQAVAVAASEQCGRTRVPTISPVASIDDWLGSVGTGADAGDAAKLLMAPSGAPPLAERVAGRRGAARWIALSGPEGGLDATEAAAAAARGFLPAGLGPLVLRADTAPLAWLAQMTALLPDRGG